MRTGGRGHRGSPCGGRGWNTREAGGRRVGAVPVSFPIPGARGGARTRQVSGQKTKQQKKGCLKSSIPPNRKQPISHATDKETEC